MSKITIIVYHYVREIEESRFPRIKGRRLDEFRRQLGYVAANYNVVTAENILEARCGGQPLPERSAWLTFDDGYIDHFVNVFPLLRERGWQGSFFPPATTTLNRELLDVNKIHFILAAEPNTRSIIKSLEDLIGSGKSVDGMQPFAAYWDSLSNEADLFDTPEVVFIKRLLQRELPETIRTEFTDVLFQKHVGIDPTDFADNLYMSVDNLREMIDGGMHVGSHGARHYWMNKLTPVEQQQEVEASLEFLRLLGVSGTNWIICYPYGANNSSLHRILRDNHCALGLTTVPGIADLNMDNHLTLPRVDTNEIPF